MGKRESFTAYCLGAIGYSIVEVVWRGFTHWTMGATGGLCFLLFHWMRSRKPNRPLWRTCVLGSGIITAAELAVGCLVNRILKWDVWDYSKMRGNLWGQICPLYSALWALLCIPMTAISKELHQFSKQADA